MARFREPEINPERVNELFAAVEEARPAIAGVGVNWNRSSASTSIEEGQDER